MNVQNKKGIFSNAHSEQREWSWKLMDIAYTRVSAKTQNLDRQIAKMREKGVEDRFIFKDVASGKNFDRPGYLTMKNILRPRRLSLY